MLGVLAEAVVPRGDRFPVQLGIAVAGLAAALVMVGVLHGTSETTVAGALAVDGTGLFIQGTVLLLAIMSVLLVAERSVDVGSPIVASAAVVVGSPDRPPAQPGRPRPDRDLPAAACSPSPAC